MEEEMEISKKHSKRDRSPTDAYMKAFRKIYPDKHNRIYLCK